VLIILLFLLTSYVNSSLIFINY